MAWESILTAQTARSAVCSQCTTTHGNHSSTDRPRWRRRCSCFPNTLLCGTVLSTRLSLTHPWPPRVLSTGLPSAWNSQFSLVYWRKSRELLYQLLPHHGDKTKKETTEEGSGTIVKKAQWSLSSFTWDSWWEHGLEESCSHPNRPWSSDWGWATSRHTSRDMTSTQPHSFFQSFQNLTNGNINERSGIQNWSLWRIYIQMQTEIGMLKKI